MKRIVIRRNLKYVLLLTAGIFLGWLFFHSPAKEASSVMEQHADSEETIWTCSMHPHIRMPEPGKCPICGMDLIPLNQAQQGSTDPLAIHLSKEAAQLANVMTSVVSSKSPVKEVRLYGKVQADERLVQSQTSHIPGRIEQLMVNFTGEQVRRGQVLARLYSPELITAQQELIEALKTRESQPMIYEAAKEKLRQWKITEDQITSIEQSGQVRTEFDILSNTNGIVTQKLVNDGDHVNEGTVLFQVADLSKVWVLFDAYESDLPFINRGARLNFTVQALPGQTFTGLISFIDPVIDPVTRVAKVRVEISNQARRLKPEMFVTGYVQSRLNQYNNDLVIPKSAVLWTGERSIVYVKDAESEEPVFRMREIGLGPSLGNSYVVVDGLTEGEEIVTQGAFSVDAAAQLEGKPSMMNPEGGTADVHDHGAMENNESVSPASDTRINLGIVYEKYIALKNSLVESDPVKAAGAAKSAARALKNVDTKLLSESDQANWMKLATHSGEMLNRIGSEEDIGIQRHEFSNLSKEFYNALKAYGQIGDTVYYQFCPMAENNKGAFWLSESGDIRNPYFGESMLTCGETKEEIRL